MDGFLYRDGVAAGVLALAGSFAVGWILRTAESRSGLALTVTDMRCLDPTYCSYRSPNEGRFFVTLGSAYRIELTVRSFRAGQSDQPEATLASDSIGSTSDVTLSAEHTHSAIADDQILRVLRFKSVSLESPLSTGHRRIQGI